MDKSTWSEGEPEMGPPNPELGPTDKINRTDYKTIYPLGNHTHTLIFLHGNQ